MSVDLSSLPPPALVETLDASAIVAAMKADLAARDPALAPALDLESEPLVKLVEAHAYRELLVRSRINDAGRGALLAFASGSTLDHLGALMNTARLITPVEDGEDLVETDEAFRARIQTAFERLSTAGPRAGYETAARSASLDIADVSVVSPAPGEVLVTVLAASGDGTPGAGLLASVTAAVSADRVRPLTDQVSVAAATPVAVPVSVNLICESGPDTALIEAAARARIEAVFSRPRRIGRVLPFSALAAGAHTEGVLQAEFSAPAGDVAIAPGEAAVAGPITITSEVAA